MSVENGVSNGLAIIASGPRDFTIVNIVGSIDLAKLHHLEGKMGVPKLPDVPYPVQMEPHLVVEFYSR